MLPHLLLSLTNAGNYLWWVGEWLVGRRFVNSSSCVVNMEWKHQRCKMIRYNKFGKETWCHYNIFNKT